MANRSLERFGLDPMIFEILTITGYKNARDVIESSPYLLMSQLNCSFKEANELIIHVSEKTSPKMNTALDIFLNLSEKRFTLPTGIKKFDEIIRGGLHFGCITEVVGPPGIGKTQFCFTSCIQALMLDYEMFGKYKGVVYVDTELKFDPIRLKHLVINTYPEQFDVNLSLDATANMDSLLSSIKVIRPMSCRDLMNEIENLENLVISDDISLIIIDSIAALARKEGLNEQDKEEYIVRQASVLKRLADLCHCVILTTNQITPCRDKGNVESNSISNYIPTLGVTWHHCVSTRINLSFQTVSAFEPPRRAITLSKSPIAQSSTFYYVIGPSGITLIE